jgi:hypothetical protein
MKGSVAAAISPWVSPALMFLWMEICFVFDEKFPGGVLGIRLEIIRDILLDFKDGEVQKTVDLDKDRAWDTGSVLRCSVVRAFFYRFHRSLELFSPIRQN